MDTIGKRIQQLRLKRGLSVDQLAEKLNKNRATVYRYENDNIENLPISIVEPLAKILQTTPAFIMGWSEQSFLSKGRALSRLEEDGDKITPEQDEALYVLIDSILRDGFPGDRE